MWFGIIKKTFVIIGLVDNLRHFNLWFCFFSFSKLLDDFILYHIQSLILPRVPFYNQIWHNENLFVGEVVNIRRFEMKYSKNMAQLIYLIQYLIELVYFIIN